MSVIEARGLVKSYGDLNAVDGIDFEVAAGESFGLLGPNGAGKSTTMRMIGGTSLRSSGTLTVLGMDPEVQGPEVRANLAARGSTAVTVLRGHPAELEAKLRAIMAATA